MGAVDIFLVPARNLAGREQSRQWRKRSSRRHSDSGKLASHAFKPARTHRSLVGAHRGVAGFLLAEVLLVLVVSAIVIATLLAGLVALVRGMQPQNVMLAGESLPISPTFGAFPSAVRLHQTFSDAVCAARAVYVFGGRHLSIPADAPPVAVQPLKAQTLPVIADFTPGLPMDAKSFYDRYAVALGAQETTAGADDFSVVVIGSVNNALGVSCFVQVRRTDLSVSDGNSTTPYTMREVKLWDAATGETQGYAFAERPAQTAKIFIGAVHTWMRYQLTAGQNEEGPACVVFPDPWVYGGSRGQADDIPPFSRFSYFLAISP